MGLLYPVYLSVRVFIKQLLFKQNYCVAMKLIKTVQYCSNLSKLFNTKFRKNKSAMYVKYFNLKWRLFKIFDANLTKLVYNTVIASLVKTMFICTNGYFVIFIGFRKKFVSIDSA